MALAKDPAPASGSISIKFGSAPKISSATAKNPKKRLHSTFVDGDYNADESERGSKSVAINTFGQNGDDSHSTSQKISAEYIIPPQKNIDWRDAVKRKRNLLPAEEQARRNGKATSMNTEEDVIEKEPVYGLNVVNKSATDTSQGGASQEENAQDNTTTIPERIKTPTADEEALAALLGKKESRGLEITKLLDTRPDLGYAASGNLETDSFRSDVELRPDAASIADYEAMPIEHFGSALLRSMGWKEGDSIGRRKDKAAVKPRVLERRPAGLGIGAKEINLKLEEPGAWGKGSAIIKKLDRNYVPLVLKNARTGETLTEAELQERNKKEQEEMDSEKGRRRNKREERYRRDGSRDRTRDDGSRRHRRDDSRDRQKRKDESRRHRRDDSRDRGSRNGESRGHRYRDDSRDRRRSDESRRYRRDKSPDDTRKDGSRRHHRDDSRDRKHGDRSRKHHRDRSPH